MPPLFGEAEGGNFIALILPKFTFKVSIYSSFEPDYGRVADPWRVAEPRRAAEPTLLILSFLVGVATTFNFSYSPHNQLALCICQQHMSVYLCSLYYLLLFCRRICLGLVYSFMCLNHTWLLVFMCILFSHFFHFSKCRFLQYMVYSFICQNWTQFLNSMRQCTQLVLPCSGCCNTCRSSCTCCF